MEPGSPVWLCCWLLFHIQVLIQFDIRLICSGLYLFFFSFLIDSSLFFVVKSKNKKNIYLITQLIFCDISFLFSHRNDLVEIKSNTKWIGHKQKHTIHTHTLTKQTNKQNHPIQKIERKKSSKKRERINIWKRID